MIIRKSEAEIDGMARAGALLAETLAAVAEHLEPGVEMRELDRIADEYIAARGGKPTSKGYKGFPASICTSPYRRPRSVRTLTRSSGKITSWM